LPRKQKALHQALTDLASERGTLIAYESPNRLVETLQAVLDVLGNRPVVVARELTKIYEDVRRGPVGEVLDYYRDNPPKGEITLVIGGTIEETGGDQPWDEERVRAALRAQLETGVSHSTAARAVALLAGWKRRDVYNLDLD
jgi:16S rRNA (cytidine1402-2'-O)-methyltransferase